MNSSNSARLHPVSITFLSDPSAFRKLLNVKIIDDEEYEKNKTFTLVLEEPILLEVGQRHGELGTQLHSFMVKYAFNTISLSLILKLSLKTVLR